MKRASIDSSAPAKPDARRILPSLLTALALAVPLTLTVPALAKHDCVAATEGRCTTEATALPGSVEEYLRLRDEIGKDPWGGAALFIMALLNREQNLAPGEKLTVLALDISKLHKDARHALYKGYSYGPSTRYLLNQADKRPYCARGHVLNATPGNNYRADLTAIRMEFRVQTRHVPDPESGKYKVFACPSGSSCRPLTLRKNSKGFWKVTEWSSLAVGCTLPKEMQDEKAKDAAEEL